ncbi:uncharacterized protein LOC143435547 [Arvicanthis niloticus]|uniref:uncharacterized protein LOC143435547 n=1 Tax=Arvicanthis niloticus TaxID=61156 RepID=UPI00403C9DA9
MVLVDACVFVVHVGVPAVECWNGKKRTAIVVNVPTFVPVPVEADPKDFPIVQLLRQKRDFGITAAIITAITVSAAAAVTAGIAMANQVQTASVISQITEKASDALETVKRTDAHLASGVLLVNQRIDLLQQQLQALGNVIQLSCVASTRSLCITPLLFDNSSLVNSSIISEYLKGNWTQELEFLQEELQLKILDLKNTSLDIISFKDFTSWLFSAFSFFKEWVRGNDSPTGEDNKYDSPAGEDNKDTKPSDSPLKTEVLALKDGNEEMKASHPVREKKILTTDADHLLLDPPPPYPPVPQAAAGQGGSASAGEPGVVTAAAGQGGSASAGEPGVVTAAAGQGGSASAGELGGVTTGTGQGNSEEQGSTTWVEPSAPLLHLEEGSLEGPAAGTRSKKVVSPDSTVLPLRAYGPPDDQGNQLFQYWPFSSADLYNWRTHNPPFSEDPQALIGLIDSLLFSHWPTWDDCQQLLQVLFTTEERQRILLEARKNVPGTDGRPTSLQNEIDAAFPLTRPDWDFNTANDREHLKIYRQTLMAGLRGAHKFGQDPCRFWSSGVKNKRRHWKKNAPSGWGPHQLIRLWSTAGYRR